MGRGRGEGRGENSIGEHLHEGELVVQGLVVCHRVVTCGCLVLGWRADVLHDSRKVRREDCWATNTRVEAMGVFVRVLGGGGSCACRLVETVSLIFALDANCDSQSVK